MGTAEGAPKKKHIHTGCVFHFQQGRTNEGGPNIKNTPMWACFLCLVGRGGEGRREEGVGSNGREEGGAGYPSKNSCQT